MIFDLIIEILRFGFCLNLCFSFVVVTRDAPAIDFADEHRTLNMFTGQKHVQDINKSETKGNEPFFVAHTDCLMSKMLHRKLKDDKSLYNFDFKG